MISDYERKLRKIGRKNTQLKKDLEIRKYQDAQMIKTLFKTLEDLGIDGKEFIKLYECNR